jgi:hypothetical protein
MTRTYCTIFNAVYLVRGLALIESLKRHCPDHRIYVFAMDAETASILETCSDPRVVVVVREGEFEPPELLPLKSSRSLAEYFWTCTSHIIRHCLRVRGHAECTYVDADVWLMSDPEPMFAEMGTASVLLTEHRYNPRHDLSATRGTYCVQFMRFVADADGLAALDWWCERCIEWCYARLEDGKFGDQKYLDGWPERFKGVHVSQHVGAGVAPWNAARTEFRLQDGQVQVRDRTGRPHGHWQPLVFFHFHGLVSYPDASVCFAFGFALPTEAKRWVYRPYARELQRLFGPLQPRMTGLAAQGVAPGASNSGAGLRRWLRRLWGLPNTERVAAV